MSATRPSPGIYNLETDLSQITQLIFQTAAAFVGAAKAGPIGAKFWSNDQAFLNTYGPPDPTTGFAHYSALAALRAGGGVWFNRVVGANAKYALTTYKNDGTNPEGLYPAGTGEADPTAHTWATGELFAIYPVSIGNLTNLVINIKNVNAGTQALVIEIYKSSNLNVPIESYSVTLGYAQDGYGRQTYITQVINGQSPSIRVVLNPAPGGKAMAATPASGQNMKAFANGVDDNAVTDGELIAGWQLFQDTNSYQFSLMGDCGYTLPDVQSAMDAVAIARNDALPVFGFPVASQGSVADLNTYRATTLNLNTSHSALYGPDYLYYDDINDLYLYVPISGGVIAAALANDLKNGNPYSPFAGIDAGKIPNCFGMRKNFSTGAGSDYDQLYVNQINLCVPQSGGSYCVFGNKTLQTIESSLSFVHARRFLNVLEPASVRGARFALFKLNTEFRRGQLQSAQQQVLNQAIADNIIYFGQAVCNDSNNSDGDTVMHLDQYIRITQDAEQIQVQTVVTSDSSSVTELIATGGNFQ